MIARSPELGGPFVLVSGNTGSGKSTAVHVLADGCGLRPYPEALDRNAYLSLLLESPREFAFHGQMAFTVLALESHAAITRDPSPAVQERGLHEVHAIFNTAHHESGYITDQEFGLLSTLVDAAEALLAEPTLLVHLDAPIDELVRRVRARGRPAESSIGAQYLSRSDLRYQSFLRSWTASPIVRFDTTQHDLRRDEGKARLVAVVTAELRAAMRR